MSAVPPQQHKSVFHTCGNGDKGNCVSKAALKRTEDKNKTVVVSATPTHRRCISHTVIAPVSGIKSPNGVHCERGVRHLIKVQL